MIMILGTKIVLLLGTIYRFSASQNGAVATVVAIYLLPILIGVGAAVDMARLHNAYTKVQADLDFALIAAVNEIGTEDEARIELKLGEWFRSQQAPLDGSFALGDVTVNLQTDVVTATASGSVPTTLMGLVGIKEMPIDVTSSAKGADKPHMQIFLVLDKSASMLLAATPAGQAKMRAEVGCTFGCHIAEGKVGKTAYKTFYDYTQARNIVLRVDVATQALSNSLAIIQEADPENQRIKVGLYKVGSQAKQVLAPTLSFAAVRQHLTQHTYGMTSSTSDETTYFDVSLPQLTKGIGAAGNGSLADRPEKLVLLVTDGVQSNRDWVHNAQHKNAPINPKWCADMKNAGVVVAVLYTEYLPMPWDWGYAATLGSTMNSAKWKTTWNGDRRPSVPGNTSRRDYMPYALKDCASSESLFLSASSQTEIENGIKDLLRTFLSAPRLTR